VNADTCTSTHYARSLHPHCTLTAPSLHPHCTLTAPSLHPPCTLTALVPGTSFPPASRFIFVLPSAVHEWTWPYMTYPRAAAYGRTIRYCTCCPHTSYCANSLWPHHQRGTAGLEMGGGCCTVMNELASCVLRPFLCNHPIWPRAQRTQPTKQGFHFLPLCKRIVPLGHPSCRTRIVKQFYSNKWLEERWRREMSTR
jgi:hypothetical protein